MAMHFKSTVLQHCNGYIKGVTMRGVFRNFVCLWLYDFIPIDDR